MRVFGLVGRSGSGKTTLIEALLPRLRARGLAVSTMKHAHHGFEMDRPGKDSHRHRSAGAQEVMVVSAERWVLAAETPGASEPDVDALIERFAPVDLVLIEGFHRHSHPKIEVHRPALGKDMIWRPGSDIVAIAADVALPGVTVPVLDLGAPEAIVDFLVTACAPLRRGREGCDLRRAVAGRG